MSKDTFKIEGYEVKQSMAKPHGNGARILVPRSWIGDQVKAVRVSDKDSNSNIQPTAVIMYEELRSQDGFKLKEILTKVVRFRNFTEVNGQIAADFSKATQSIKVTETLEEIVSEENRNGDIEDFYKMIIQNRKSKANFLTELKTWI